MIHTVYVKPMSVNKARQWKRYKSKDYVKYAKVLYSMLPNDINFIKEDKYKVYYEFWVSSKLADIDNPIKPFQDVLQLKYWFDDKSIYEMRIVKKDVKKWEEYISFSIESIIIN